MDRLALALANLPDYQPRQGESGGKRFLGNFLSSGAQAFSGNRLRAMSEDMKQAEQRRSRAAQINQANLRASAEAKGVRQGMRQERGAAARLKPKPAELTPEERAYQSARGTLRANKEAGTGAYRPRVARKAPKPEAVDFDPMDRRALGVAEQNAREYPTPETEAAVKRAAAGGISRVLRKVNTMEDLGSVVEMAKQYGVTSDPGVVRAYQEAKGRAVGKR